jgi:hypothetical protein
MTKPAKDEAELLERVRQAIWHHGDGREDAEAAIGAIRAAGWAVVPVEATEEIRDAVIDAAFDLEYITEDDDAAKIYQAAIKAAALEVKP